MYRYYAELFINQFGVKDIDPRWLHYGIVKHAHTNKRDSWVYVTSDMSNPWESEEPNDFPSAFDLISGKMDILQIAGITAAEWEFAKENGSDVLAEN